MTSTSTDESVAERLRAEHGPARTLGDACDLHDDLVVEISSGAAIDRLVHQVEVHSLKGESYRMRGRSELGRTPTSND
ncbi:hypothetical protein [Streptomyces sp. NPDC056549]|uniref:hypothetical protein n=1 Tax=Streptomyces sp. NPDC056549 TaxID=3345864 RepID=UPI0036BB3513